MAFEYSESVYGVRTYGSSVGEVINAAAATTATSSIADVNWVVAIGADASLTATASITCSGEVVVIEDTSEFDYGTGLYGANQFGIENLQTIVSATSSIANITAVRVRLATGIVVSEAAVATIGGFTASASGTITVTSATTASGQVVGERSAALTATSTVTQTGNATFASGSTVTVTSATTCAAEEFFLESSDKMVYGHGLYGEQVYDQADLQTIVSATSVGTTASCERILATTTATSTVAAAISANARRVALGSVLINGVSTTVSTSTGNGSRVRTSGGTATPEATIASVGFATRGGSATASAAASLTSNAVTVVVADATLTAAATIAAVCNRVRFGSGVPTAVASITVLGFATRGGIASCTPAASLVAASEKIWQGSTTAQPEALFTAACNRVQNTSGIVSATSVTTTIGREKWEIIVNDSVTWTEIAA